MLCRLGSLLLDLESLDGVARRFARIDRVDAPVQLVARVGGRLSRLDDALTGDRCIVAEGSAETHLAAPAPG